MENRLPYVVITIDCESIVDWDSFHSVFSEAFGFPEYYGRNMNAWIDCLTYIDDPKAGMSEAHAPAGGVLVLQLEHAKDFAMRYAELYAAMVEGIAFVNWRRLEKGEAPALILSFWK
jgi:Barstar (barnase inhibitor)